MTTTPEPVSSAPDTDTPDLVGAVHQALQLDAITAAHVALWGDDPGWVNTTLNEILENAILDSVVQRVSPLLAGLRADLDQARAEVDRLETLVVEKHELIQGWARYGERVKADRVRFGDMLIAALGLQDEPVSRHFHRLVPQACEEIARLRVELAGARTIPDDAAGENPYERAEEIADRIAHEEPTAGAGRVTLRLLHALFEAGLIVKSATPTTVGSSGETSNAEPGSVGASDEVRALLVHPAAWNGLVAWLASRGLTVDSAGDLEGIPTYSMGISDELAAATGLDGEWKHRHDPAEDIGCSNPPAVSCADAGCPIHGWTDEESDDDE